MANRRLTWGWPPVGPRQAALSHASIEFRVDPSLPWTEQDLVPADEPGELLFVDVAPGTFFYRCTIFDVEGQPDSNPAETSAIGAYDPPSSALNFTATDE